MNSKQRWKYRPVKLYNAPINVLFIMFLGIPVYLMRDGRLNAPLAYINQIAPRLTLCRNNIAPLRTAGFAPQLAAWHLPLCKTP